MELRDYDPWPAVGGAQDFASFMKHSAPESDGTWKQVLEAFHNERELVLRFEIPGVAPVDIDLRVDNRVLHVRGVRRSAEQPQPELLLRDERYYGPFDRSIALPEGTAADAIQATYLHGVLDVRVPHNRRPDATAVPMTVENLEPTPIDVAKSD
jgi:HSP20 family protein